MPASAISHDAQGPMSVPGAVLVVGKLVVDEVVRTSSPIVPGSGQRASDHTVTGGGQVWHTAHVLAAAGAQVAVTGWCGPDPDARRLRERLASAGIEDRLQELKVAGPRSLVLVGPDGDRAIVSLPAPAQFEDAPGLLEGIGWVHIDAHALAEGSAEGIVSLARRAARAGIPVSLEPTNPARTADQAPWLSQLPALEVLFGRPDELEATTQLLASRPQLQVAHDGPSPARAQGLGKQVRADVPEIDQVATTGAGDRFCGGWLAQRWRYRGPSTTTTELLELLRAAIDAALHPGPDAGSR